MTNTTRRFKLEYTDSGENVQTIAELGQDTGALRIDRFVEFKRKNDPDILKVWLEGDDFGNTIPTRKGEFGTASNGTDEPEIRLKQYNPDTSSFDLVNRFYAKNKGTINEQGELALKLYSFFKYTARQVAQTGTITDTNGNGFVDIEDALNATLPSGYTADVPGSVTPPTVSGYSLDNTRREKGYHELTRDFKWAMTFLGEVDGNNDALVKYEPEGFGGTVDTLVSNEQAAAYSITAVDTTNDIFTVRGDVTDKLVIDQAILVNGSTGNDGTYTITNLSYDGTNNETDITVSENVSSSTADGQIIPGGQAIFKSWEKDKTDAIINKVRVEGTKPSDNTEVIGTATNQTQIDNFGEKFLKVKRGYIETTSEADTIAESYLVPGLNDNGTDITTVPESGTVKTSVYSDNVVNDSFQVVNNTRNIDDTYTVVEQRNYWPEGATELEFEFEKENLEGAARESENLRDERGRLYPSDQTDVGNQNVDADTEDVTDSYDDFGNDDHPHGNNDSISDNNSTQFSTVLNSTASSTTLSDGESDSVSGSVTYDGNAYQINYLLDTDAGYGAEFIVQVDSAGDIKESYVTKTNNGGEIRGQLSGLDDISGETVELLYVNKSGGSVTVTPTLAVAGEAQHDHNVPISDTNNNTTGGNNNTNTNDSTAGDTTSLNATGSTDTKNVNVSTEDKTDR